jgi:hypothetical protein
MKRMIFLILIMMKVLSSKIVIEVSKDERLRMLKKDWVNITVRYEIKTETELPEKCTAKIIEIKKEMPNIPKEKLSDQYSSQSDQEHLTN